MAHSVGAASGARVPWVAVGGSCLSRCRCAARLLKTRWPWPGLSETRWRWGAGLEADVYCSWLSAGPLGSGERELEPRLRRGSFLSLLTCASLSRSRFQAHRSSRSKTTAPPLRPPGALCCLHSSHFASPSAHPHAAMHAVGAFHPCVCACVCVCARACVRVHAPGALPFPVLRVLRAGRPLSPQLHPISRSGCSRVFWSRASPDECLCCLARVLLGNKSCFSRHLCAHWGPWLFVEGKRANLRSHSTGTGFDPQPLCWNPDNPRVCVAPGPQRQAVGRCD